MNGQYKRVIYIHRVTLMRLHIGTIPICQSIKSVGLSEISQYLFQPTPKYPLHFQSSSNNTSATMNTIISAILAFATLTLAQRNPSSNPEATCFGKEPPFCPQGSTCRPHPYLRCFGSPQPGCPGVCVKPIQRCITIADCPQQGGRWVCSRRARTAMRRFAQKNVAVLSRNSAQMWGESV